MAPQHAVPLKIVSERAREHETFKYDPTLWSRIRYNDTGVPFPSEELASSPDAVLTALARLGASQLGSPDCRCLISLFDQKYQYFIAEATSTLRLTPSLQHEERNQTALWLCGTAIPRVHGVCEYALIGLDVAGFDSSKNSPDLPVQIVPDLTDDARFSSKPYCLPGSPARFYAGAPIRTNRGVNIGVFCVLDTIRRDDWDDKQSELIRDLSRTVMDHLEATRGVAASRHNERMIRGISSFVDGKSTMSGWQDGPNTAAFANLPAQEGGLNSKQQALEVARQNITQLSSNLSEDDETPIVEPHLFEIEKSFDVYSAQAMDQKEGQLTNGGGIHLSSSSNSAAPTRFILTDAAEDMSITPAELFSKAANIIREAIEVEGCLFVDAKSVLSQDPDSTEYPDDPGRLVGHSSASSGDEARTDPSSDARRSFCRVLGFSTSEKSSIDADKPTSPQMILPRKLLSRLFKRYPKGKIFNFDENGELETSESSEDDSGARNLSEQLGSLSTPQAAHTSQSQPFKQSIVKGDVAAAILRFIPKARSVVFVPIWDPRQEAWYSAALVYTLSPTRIMRDDGELSYLTGFGTLLMADILRARTAATDKAKSDVLSSLSHELRSPLHGVTLGVELLNDTDLSVFQGNITHTIEICCRNLIETMDHLLDFSKINHFRNSVRTQDRAAGPRDARHGTAKSIESGILSLFSDVSVAALAEEVVESVFAGFTFQHLSIAQIARSRRTTFSDTQAYQRLDSIQAIEEFGRIGVEAGKSNLDFSAVSIILDIDASKPWTYYTQPGAIRRVIMNLFANALKYTERGKVIVSLTHEPSKKLRSKQPAVKISVIDTGCGIGPDFLRHRIFEPFSQEDHLKPGTGLGLSMVKQIVSGLGGVISIESSLGIGTTVSVWLPLTQAQSPPTPSTGPLDEDGEFIERVSQLKALRIRVMGAKASEPLDEHRQHRKRLLDDYTAVERICRDWLHLEVIARSDVPQTSTELVIWLEDALSAETSQHLELDRAPNVVVCKNALVAYERSNSTDYKEKGRVIEFISQPLGPRKLAKVLVLALDQWVKQQPLTPALEKPFPARDLPNLDSKALSFSDFSVPVGRLPSPPHLSRDERASISSIPLEPPTNVPASSPEQERTPVPEFLLVDDNKINLKILASYMSKLKRPFTTASNGAEAVAAYRDHAGAPYKCVLMDISMPVMDGIEATRRIRAYERDKNMKPTAIFALTGLASASVQEEATDSGFDLFLTKPVRLQEIGSILKRRELI